MSWCRELDATAGRQWAGALSVPVVLRRDGDRVALTPHPGVDSLGTGRTAAITGPAEAAVGAHVDVVVQGVPEVVLRAGGVAVLRLSADAAGGALHVERPGLPRVGPWPLDAGSPVRVLCDGDVVEVFSAGGAGAVRITALPGPRTLELTAPGSRAVVHDMELCFPP